jgi:hypothetical protein
VHVLKVLEAAVISKRDQPVIEPTLFVQLVRGLPTEWEECVETTLLGPSSTFSSLAVCLTLLRELGGIEAKENGASTVTAQALAAPIQENMRTYVDYIRTLIEKQLKVDQFLHVLRLAPPCFAPDKLHVILIETLRIAELVTVNIESHLQSNPGTPSTSSMLATRDQPLLYSIQCVISLLNSCPRESKHFPRLWDGLTGATNASSRALTYLNAACTSLSSVEHMALMVERCIALHFARYKDSQQWSMVEEVLHIPELEESAFIRHCLNHALAMTLYAHSRKRLGTCNNNVEMKVMMGEQLGVWIESLRVENVEQSQERYANISVVSHYPKLMHALLSMRLVFAVVCIGHHLKDDANAKISNLN